MKISYFLIALCWGIVLFSQDTLAINYEIFRGEEKVSLLLVGEIDFSVPNIINSALSTEEEKPLVIILNSTGGFLAPAIEAANMIEKSGRDISTLVINECSSACIMIYLSASLEKRQMESRAVLGFHAAHTNGKFDSKATIFAMQFIEARTNSWVNSYLEVFSSIRLSKYYPEEMIALDWGIVTRENILDLRTGTGE